MQLIHNLRDEDLTDYLLEGEELELQKFFAAEPQFLQIATERPSWFWQRQLSAVRGRLGARQRSTFRPVFAAASALALLLLAFSVLKNGPTATPAEVQNDPDQQLLLAVEQTVETDGPESLEPATLITDEISNTAQTIYRTRNVAKEKENEREN
jgi:hypothetical protein